MNNKTMQLVRLTKLMELSEGRSEVAVALIDGPVDTSQPGLAVKNVRYVSNLSASHRVFKDPSTYTHGTAVASILHATRDVSLPGVCPGCTLLLYPITRATAHSAPVRAQDLAVAIRRCVDDGSNIINISLGFSRPSTRENSDLDIAIDYAVRRGVILFAAAGNQGAVGSTALTRHPGVIPVAAFSTTGALFPYSNLSPSLGRMGLGGPGEVNSFDGGKGLWLRGTSVAVPFVSGTAALLRSVFPLAPAEAIRAALVRPDRRRPLTIVPPLLDAWRSFLVLRAAQRARA